MPPCSIYRPAALAVGCAVIGSLAACGAGSVSGSEPVAVPAPPKATPEAATPAPDPLVAYYELPEGTVRVTGVVFAAGEDMQPRRPFRSGVIVAMSHERYERFQLEVRGPWKSALMTGRDFPLPGGLLGEPGVHRSDLDASGTYSLTITPGDYKLCLGNLSEVDRTPSPDTDVWVDKAFDATVTDEELQTFIPVLDRSTGELVLHR